MFSGRITLSFLVLLSYASPAAKADNLLQSQRLYENLNGIPAKDETLNQMVSHLEAGDGISAALLAIDDPEGMFYDSVLRRLANVWANENRAARFELNDMTATVIGMVRDGKPFNQLLSSDLVYIADDASLPEYSLNNNDHYNELAEKNLRLKDILVATKQSDLTNLPKDAVAGLLTTRGFAKAYYIDGTNRAALRFTVFNFLCRDMERLTDTSRPDFRVRQDVSRNPGGDASTYKTKCVGCHAGMDALAGAFAYYDYNNDRLTYFPIRPDPKYFVNNDNFPQGFVTQDDSWVNLWVDGPNKVLGFRGIPKGKGVKSFGRMITQTEQFSKCMASEALVAVCRADPEDIAVQNVRDILAASFEQDDYNMKNLFASAALSCSGGDQ